MCCNFQPIEQPIALPITIQNVADFIRDGGDAAVAAIQNLMPRPSPALAHQDVNIGHVVAFLNRCSENEMMQLQGLVHPERAEMQFDDLLRTLQHMTREQHLLLQGAIRQVIYHNNRMDAYLNAINTMIITFISLFHSRCPPISKLHGPTYSVQSTQWTRSNPSRRFWSHTAPFCLLSGETCA